MKLKPETVGFVRGGMLFLEPPHRWRSWQRDVWTCCAYPTAKIWICRDCHASVRVIGGPPSFCVHCRGRRMVEAGARARTE